MAEEKEEREEKQEPAVQENVPLEQQVIGWWRVSLVDPRDEQKEQQPLGYIERTAAPADVERAKRIVRTEFFPKYGPGLYLLQPCDQNRRPLSKPGILEFIKAMEDEDVGEKREDPLEVYAKMLEQQAKLQQMREFKRMLKEDREEEEDSGPSYPQRPSAPPPPYYDPYEPPYHRRHSEIKQLEERLNKLADVVEKLADQVRGGSMNMPMMMMQYWQTQLQIQQQQMELERRRLEAEMAMREKKLEAEEKRLAEEMKLRRQELEAERERLRHELEAKKAEILAQREEERRERELRRKEMEQQRREEKERLERELQVRLQELRQQYEMQLAERRERDKFFTQVLNLLQEGAQKGLSGKEISEFLQRNAAFLQQIVQNSISTQIQLANQVSSLLLEREGMGEERRGHLEGLKEIAKSVAEITTSLAGHGTQSAPTNKQLPAANISGGAKMILDKIKDYPDFVKAFVIAIAQKDDPALHAQAFNAVFQEATATVCNLPWEDVKQALSLIVDENGKKILEHPDSEAYWERFTKFVKRWMTETLEYLRGQAQKQSQASAEGKQKPKATNKKEEG